MYVCVALIIDYVVIFNCKIFLSRKFEIVPSGARKKKTSLHILCSQILAWVIERGYYSGKNEMDWARGTCETEKRYVQDLGAET
jgi:hypothetical protein